MVIRTREPDGRITGRSRHSDARAGAVWGLVPIDRDVGQLAHVRPTVRVVPVVGGQLAHIQLVPLAALGALHVCVHQGKHVAMRSGRG